MKPDHLEYSYILYFLFFHFRVAGLHLNASIKRNREFRLSIFVVHVIALVADDDKPGKITHPVHNFFVLRSSDVISFERAS